MKEEEDKRQTQVQSLINRHKAEKPVGIGGQAIKLHEWPDFKKHMKPADDDVADEAAAFDLFG